MTYNTPNRNYPVPEDGQDPWDQPIQDSFGLIDADIDSLFATVAAGGIDATVELGKGNIVCVATSTDVTDSINPSSTSTPVQDAIDLVGAAGGGTIFLPPKTISEQGNIVMAPKTTILGTFGETTIDVGQSGTNVDGFIFDASATPYTNDSFLKYIYIDGIRITGNGINTAMGAAFHDKGIWRGEIGRVAVENWSGELWKSDGRQTFELHIRFMYGKNLDAGDRNALVAFEPGGLGAPANIDYLAVYPFADRTGQFSTVLYQYGGKLTVGTMNIGGQPAEAVKTTFHRSLLIRQINWEPQPSGYNPPSELYSVVNIDGNRPFVLDNLTMWEPATYAYSVTGGSGKWRLPEPYFQSLGAVTSGKMLNVEGSQNGHSFYYGPSSQINGSLTNIHALGDI